MSAFRENARYFQGSFRKQIKQLLGCPAKEHERTNIQTNQPGNERKNEEKNELIKERKSERMNAMPINQLMKTDRSIDRSIDL